MPLSKTEQQHREEIVEIGRRLHQQGFIAGTDGNLSVRIDSERILTTPTGMSKGMLRPEDLVLVDKKGSRLSGFREASSELGMHLTIYESRPEVNAVIHSHPPTATGYAAAGLPLDKALLAEVVVVLGSVPLARYATPGSPALSEVLRELIPHHDAILMANHGVVTCGQDLLQAYFRMETVEHYARVSLVTELLGKQTLLSGQDVEKLMELRSRYLGSTNRPLG